MLTRNSRPSLGEGIALGLVATGAVSVAVAAIVSVCVAAGDIFTASPTVQMPVHDVDAPELASSTGVTGAMYDSALVTFATLPTGARWLLLLEAALPALGTVALCAFAWWLGVSLIRSRPFRASMGWMLGLASCLVLAGGLFGQLAGGIGRAVAVQDLANADPEVEDVLWTFLVQLDLAPVGWAFALALVATAFQLGTRMQRDTEGLV